VAVYRSEAFRLPFSARGPVAAVHRPSPVDFPHSAQVLRRIRREQDLLDLPCRCCCNRRHTSRPRRLRRVRACLIAQFDMCATVTTSAWTQGWLVCYDADFDGDCDDTATGNPNPIRQHAALESTLTLTGPAAVARFNANGSQGAAGAASLTFTTRGTWTGS